MADRRWSQIDSKTWRFDEGPYVFSSWWETTVPYLWTVA